MPAIRLKQRCQRQSQTQSPRAYKQPEMSDEQKAKKKLRKKKKRG